MKISIFYANIQWKVKHIIKPSWTILYHPTNKADRDIKHCIVEARVLKDNWVKQCLMMLGLLAAPAHQQQWHRSKGKWTFALTTRTTRKPAFWYTPAAPWLVIHIRSQVRTKQSQSYKFRKLSKILQETIHTTHLLDSIDKMLKYEMDPTRTLGTEEQTLDAGWTADRVKQI